jgi:hypothetical protein
MAYLSDFFVVYNLCLGGGLDQDTAEPRRVVFDMTEAGILVRSVYIVNKKRLSPSFVPHAYQGRFAFWIDRRHDESTFPQRVIDGLFATLTLLYKTDLSRGMPLFAAGPVPCRVPGRVLKYDTFLKRNDLIRSDRRWEVLLDYCHTIPESIIETAWNMLPVVLHKPFFDAVHYYQASIRDFCFEGYSIAAVANGDMAQPISRSEWSQAEDAVLNAFKAIEAVIGDPPKDDKKFQSKLQCAGIDPFALVGFVARGSDEGSDKREPIWQKIRAMGLIRDKKAAHGRSGADRQITLYEIMEIQACAEVVVKLGIDYEVNSTNRIRSASL